jgi:hypothetical protein
MPETRRHPPAWSISTCFLPLACCASLLTGCAGDNRSTYDPLIGGTPAGQRTGVPPAPTGTPSAAAASSSATLPPLPVARSSTSPAALAGGTGQSLDGSHDPLRIADPQAGGAWKGSQTGVVLNRPELAPDPVRPSNVVAPPAGPVAAPGIALTAGGRAITYEQAQALLAARGVKVQRLESTGENGEWKFTCSVPNRQNPQISRTYEARATDPIAAVRAVLDQLDKDQR